MIQSLLIANRGEIACRIIRTQILPGTGRGTASWRWRGRSRSSTNLIFGASPHPAPSSLRATSPFRGGFLGE